MQKWLILGVVVVVCILTTFIVFNLEIETEYVPEVEVSSEELRKSLVSVYLKNKTSNELVKENILVDSKMLLKNPYGEFVSMLINGSENDNLVSVFPEGISMPEVKFDKGVVSVEIMGDAVETVIGCGNILKNSVGVLGVIIIIGIILIPIIKVTLLMFSFKLTSAVCEIIADEKIVKLIDDVSDTYKILLAILISISIMFIIGITIVIKITNSSIMYR